LICSILPRSFGSSDRVSPHFGIVLRNSHTLCAWATPPCRRWHSPRSPAPRRSRRTRAGVALRRSRRPSRTGRSARSRRTRRAPRSARGSSPRAAAFPSAAPAAGATHARPPRRHPP
jgi:hypothetical protein